MAKRSGLASTGRGSRANGDPAGRGSGGKPARTANNGGRALPGKVPRGSLQRTAGSALTPLVRAIFEKIDRGIVLLDAKGAVIDSNSIARCVLANGNGILLRNGRLFFADADLEDRFEEMLKSNGHADGSSRVVAAIVKRPGVASCRVLVSPVVTDDGHAQAVAYIAVIFAPAEQRAITPKVLTEIYRLTRAQADVARQLYAGLSVEETATELKLSLNTVRTHLKQIFSKCEVQSQAELLYALALGPQDF
jgi:DNA-binding CsgD family transcriptional regulator